MIRSLLTEHGHGTHYSGLACRYVNIAALPALRRLLVLLSLCIINNNSSSNNSNNKNNNNK